MADESKLTRLETRLGDHTAHLILIWPLLISVMFLSYYVGQRATEKDLNLLAVVLTVFEVFLVVALAAGFWMVRGAAVEKAEDAARSVARECAEAQVREYVKLFITPRLVREIIEGSEDLGGGANLTEQSVDDMMKGLE